jgi:hypothetical protein
MWKEKSLGGSGLLQLAAFKLVERDSRFYEVRRRWRRQEFTMNVSGLLTASRRPPALSFETFFLHTPVALLSPKRLLKAAAESGFRLADHPRGALSSLRL